MANLGAVCYKAVKAGLYEQWSASMEGDESAKAEVWRQEGRQAMLESVKAKLAAAESLHEQLAQLNVAREADRARAEQFLQTETDILKKEISALQKRHSQCIESEVDSRLSDVIRKTEERKDTEAAPLRMKISSLTEENTTLMMLETSKAKKYTALEQELAELVKRHEDVRRQFTDELAARLEEAKEIQKLTVQHQTASEISELRQQIAALKSQGELLVSKEATCTLLTEKNANLEAELDKTRLQLDTIRVKNTKSSYAIGKDGEALIMDVLREYVLPTFLYSHARDVNGIGHSADIHLYLQSPVGKQMKILIDAKKYTEAVRVKEITKLHSDVDTDDDAMAGIMISTDSQISSVKQFQIEKTPKGKYIMYVSVEGFDDELRGRTICWAIRVLSTLASYYDDSDTNIVEKIVEFFKDLELTVKEADSVVKSCQKSLDLATTMKKNLAKRMDDFRLDNLASVPVSVPVVETKVPVTRAKAGATKSKKKTAAELFTP